MNLVDIKKTYAALIHAFLCSRLGRYIALGYLNQNPDVAIAILQKANRKGIADIYTHEIRCPRNFEDLTWLFSCNKSNRGILRLNFDEAGYLFSLARSIPRAKILEIGRFEGGSVVLFAAATDDQSHITSIDIRPRNDKVLREVLRTFNFHHRIELVVGDANAMDPPLEEYNIVFIDGNHSYESVIQDYERWKVSVKKEGHLIFHDYSNSAPGVISLVNEIKDNDRSMFQENKRVGSIVDFIKIN